jgi:coproporphyrinogen III oxidase-like Fe-S oxidoreductase
MPVGADSVELTQQAELPISTAERRLLIVYVNIPFCRSKCTFCDYVQPIPTKDLLRGPQDSVRQQYVNALCTEIEVRGRELSGIGYLPKVLYWGGGTASILEPGEINRVASSLNEVFDLSSMAEATIECSPDTLNPAKLALFRASGFNRFSSGVQSMRDERLRYFGRRHTADQARQAVHWAREAGFENVNIDIMCGFPDEGLDEVRYTVNEALKLPIEHLSLYPFRPTGGTSLRRQIDKDRGQLYLAVQKAAFSTARAMVLDAGMSEYASGYFGLTSLFAAMYFQLRADIAGFGSGAMSLLSQRFLAHTKGRLHDYIAAPTVYDFSAAASDDPIVLSNLRAGISMFDGVLRRQWEFATGTPLDESISRPALVPFVNHLRKRGLTEDEQGMRLPREEVGRTLIELSFHTAAAQTRADSPG